MPMLELLAINGSLRAGGSHAALLAAAARVAPPAVRVVHYDGLATLPAFDPELDTPDGARLPDAVRVLRARVARADGLLIASPEYAHGIAGALKNLLDWLVGSVDVAGMPVALLEPSARAVHAPAQLREVLRTMATRVIEPASLTLPIAGRTTARGQPLDAAAIAADPALAAPLAAAMRTLADAIAAPPA